MNSHGYSMHYAVDSTCKGGIVARIIHLEICCREMMTVWNAFDPLEDNYS